MIQTKAHTFQRDLGNLVVVTHMTLVKSSEVNWVSKMETEARITPPQIYGTERHRIWHRNYVEAIGGIWESLSSLVSYVKSDSIESEIGPAELWAAPKSRLDGKFLKQEHTYAQKKVDEIVAGSNGEDSRALVCSLPFYLQLARGYAKLVGDPSWNSERVSTVARDSFDNMCQQVRGLLQSTIGNEDLHENDCRRVLPKNLYNDDIAATAEALQKYAGIKVEKTKLRDLFQLYENGLHSGKIKDGPEW